MIGVEAQQPANEGGTTKYHDRQDHYRVNLFSDFSLLESVTNRLRHRLGQTSIAAAFVIGRFGAIERRRCGSKHADWRSPVTLGWRLGFQLEQE